MLIYNKVEDIYHTSLRIISYLNKMRSSSIDLRALIIVDLLYCFPQYRDTLCHKRKLKFLKMKKSFERYSGARASHVFLIEKSVYGAIKLLAAKGIINVSSSILLVSRGRINEIQIPFDHGLESIFSFIESNGIGLLNEELRIFEGKYEKISPA